MPVQIGHIVLPHGLLLAPMAGVTDAAFRRICRQAGAEYMTTEMISAMALWYHDKKTAALAKITQDEMPCAVQIFGHEPNIMAQAAKTLSEGLPGAGEAPVAIDINMGCPVPKIVNNGEGSALMKNPLLAGQIMSAVRSATTLPVTVKFRTGFTASEKNCVEFAHIAVECGMDMLCVHGRTRTQMYAPPVDLDSIARVRQAVPSRIPVIGNGDIYTAADALRMLEYTGCDGIALARGVCGNPWLFNEILAAMEHRTFSPPTMAERLAAAQQHLMLLIENKGSYTGVREARKHLAWYTKGLPGSAAMRIAINRAETMEELRFILAGGTAEDTQEKA